MDFAAVRAGLAAGFALAFAAGARVMLVARSITAEKNALKKKRAVG